MRNQNVPPLLLWEMVDTPQNRRNEARLLQKKNRKKEHFSPSCVARDFENLSIFQIDRGESSFCTLAANAQSKAFKASLKENFRLAPPLRAQNDAASKITKKQFF